MARIKGKKQLCSCEKNYFKSFQGVGGHSLFERYNDIENIVNRRIDAQYRHFLAQPQVDDNTITWFAKPYIETPQCLSKLQGDEKTKYEQIKNDTLAHYLNTINSLKNEGKNSEAESIENALKFVNDDFVFCYDNKTVLGIWGMQLKETVRESSGTFAKNLFVPIESEPIIIENTAPPIEEINVPPIKPFTIRFSAGENGNINGQSEFYMYAGDILLEDDLPKIEPKLGYEFTGWNQNLNNFSVSGNEEFTAQYKSIMPTVAKLPWYNRLWNWLSALFMSRRWIKWLLGLLLILLLIILFKKCNDKPALPIPYPIKDKPWINNDPRVGDSGGIYDPGNPYTPKPTPPNYSNVLPPNQGVLPPIDKSKIIRVPGKPVVIGNRLNILMENQDKSIMDFAKAFKQKYPDEKYKVVYYDDVVKRMQIEIPMNERGKLKSVIPAQFAPEYELFVFDESLFKEGYSPTDPAFADPNKAWYLKAINAPQAWDIAKGNIGAKKLTIAIVDNGFSLNHPELQSKVVMPYNVWLHSKEVFAQAVDHGTHVAGTALANANNDKGLCGIAFESAFMPIQVANQQNLMTTTSVLDGILYALYQGADVINVSLGMEFEGSLPENVQQDLQDNHFKEEERLWNEVMKISQKHKAVIVVAAGNENMLSGVNPMNRPKNFIVVSAINQSNQEYTKAGFSNYGSYSTISAPGVNIYSSSGSNDYQLMSGTSMASPIVAGAVALMKSLNENLTAEEIICVLQGTGKSTTGNVGKLIQIDKALEKVKLGEFIDCGTQPEIPSTGDVQVLLNWNNYNDLDLVCVDPYNESIWFKNKRVTSGGKLEIDMNVDYPDNDTPIENIFWKPGTAPNGTYNVYLIYYKKHINIDETPYKITVKYGGKTEEFTGTIKLENKSIPICSFTLGGSNSSNNTEQNSTNKRREELLKDRGDLQNQLNRIDQELQNIKKITN